MPVQQFTSKISSRVAARLTGDHISALFPDVNTPFRDVEDVVDRLLPYHVFQHPREDLLKATKGKGKATETEILQSELAGASVIRAKHCFFFFCLQSTQKQSSHSSASSADRRSRNAFGVVGRSLARQVTSHIFASAIRSLRASALRPMIKHTSLNDK